MHNLRTRYISRVKIALWRFQQLYLSLTRVCKSVSLKLFKPRGSYVDFILEVAY